jgi:hypothetical protein
MRAAPGMPALLQGFQDACKFSHSPSGHGKQRGPRGCGRDVSHPISSGWSSGPRAAGTVADLSAQREAERLPGIDDSDSDFSGRAGRGQVDHDEGGQDHPAAADSEEEEAGPAVPDSPAGHGGAAQVHIYKYL